MRNLFLGTSAIVALSFVASGALAQQTNDHMSKPSEHTAPAEKAGAVRNAVANKTMHHQNKAAGNSAAPRPNGEAARPIEGAGKPIHAAQGREHPGKQARIDTTQRTRIQETIRSEHFTDVGRVNFAVNVGTVVPANYHFYPLPPELVSFVPEYSGYDYIVAENNILIIDPATGEIVDVIAL
jgi:hypothetical protein